MAAATEGEKKSTADIDPAIGQRIKELRLERNLTQRQLGGPGHSYAYISRIETGTRTPSAKALVKIAEKLGTTAIFLMTGNPLADCPVCGKVNGIPHE